MRTTLWAFIVAVVGVSIAACEGPKNPRDPALGGQSEVSLSSGGITRWFIQVLPTSSAGKTPLPLVLAYHGGGGGMAQMAEQRGDLIARAQATPFVLAFPNGQDLVDNRGRSAWNAVHCCDRAFTEGKSDVQFARDVVAKISATQAIDPRRIYAIGFSNGGMLVHRLAAEATDLFAAVAVNSGTIGGRYDMNSAETRIAPRGPLPIYLLHGKADTVVRYLGGVSTGNPQRVDLSFADSVSLWQSANQCGKTPMVQTIPGDKRNAGIETYPGCRADLSAMSVDNMAHGWADGPFAGIDGIGRMVDFLLAHLK